MNVTTTHIEVESVVIGDLFQTFYTHGVSTEATMAILSFLTKVWILNEIPMHEELTKTQLGLLDLSEMDESLLILNALPKLLQIGTLIREGVKGRVLHSFLVDTHTINLEYYK